MAPIAPPAAKLRVGSLPLTTSERSRASRPRWPAAAYSLLVEHRKQAISLAKNPPCKGVTVCISPRLVDVAVHNSYRILDHAFSWSCKSVGDLAFSSSRTKWWTVAAQQISKTLRSETHRRQGPPPRGNGNVTTLGWVENPKEWHPANQAIPKIWEEKGECTQTCKYSTTISTTTSKVCTVLYNQLNFTVPYC